MMCYLFIRSPECKMPRQRDSNCRFVCVFTAVDNRHVEFELITAVFTDSQFVLVPLVSGNKCTTTYKSLQLLLK